MNGPQYHGSYHGRERRHVTQDQLNEAILLGVREVVSEMQHTDCLSPELRRFITEMVEQAERRRQRWDTIKTQVGGWTIIAVLGMIGSVVFKAAASALARLDW